MLGVKVRVKVDLDASARPTTIFVHSAPTGRHCIGMLQPSQIIAPASGWCRYARVGGGELVFACGIDEVA